MHKANKRGTSGSKWKQAYQAVKHNRKSSFKMASIENLLHAMGALYILNLYYRNETFNIEQVYRGTKKFDNCVGSDLFSVFNYSATGLKISQCMDDSCILQMPDNDLDKSIYVTKYDDKSFKDMHESFCKDHEVTVKNFMNSLEIIEFLNENPDYKGETINKTCLDAGGVKLLTKILSLSHSRNNEETIIEAVINKHTNIYPVCNGGSNLI